MKLTAAQIAFCDAYERELAKTPGLRERLAEFHQGSARQGNGALVESGGPSACHIADLGGEALGAPGRVQKVLRKPLYRGVTLKGATRGKAFGKKGNDKGLQSRDARQQVVVDRFHGGFLQKCFRRIGALFRRGAQ